jgi:hypothetical protein
MSERGSFVTEYIYCAACLKAVKRALRKWRGTVECRQLSGRAIIAGFVSESYRGGELALFEHEIIPAIAAAACHPVRVAVLAEKGEKVFVAEKSR